MCFYHPGRGIRGLVHGDDFVFSGFDKYLEWVARELAKNILLKVVGKLGDDVAGGDQQEV